MLPNLNKILDKISNNPFKALTFEEKSALQEKEKEVKREIKELSIAAKGLFDDQRYKLLRKKFDRIYKDNLYELINYDCEDPQKYAHVMMKLQTRLRTLKNIFDTPEGFIKAEEALEKKINV